MILMHGMRGPACSADQIPAPLARPNCTQLLEIVVGFLQRSQRDHVDPKLYTDISEVMRELNHD